MSRFMDVPVSLYSGTADIGIDILTVESGALSIPVRLAYYSRGATVSEHASSVGLGWSLQYGGSITRQTRDLPDDGLYGYLGQSYYNQVFTDVVYWSQMYEDLLNFNIDMEPDQFYINTPGIQNKFIVNQIDKKVLLQSLEDTHVEYEHGVDGYISGWTVKDQAGNTYYYGLSKDKTRSAKDVDWVLGSYRFVSGSGMEALATSDPRAPNTWHLMEVETPGGKRIEFHYQVENSRFYRRNFDQLDRETDIPMAYFSHIDSHRYRIWEIRYGGGKVVFTAGTADRQDMEGGKALERIQVLGPEGSMLKDFQLGHTFVSSTVDGNVLAYLASVEPQAAKRMYLSTLTERSSDLVSLPPYVFQYHNPSQLGHRFTNSQDNWGYYNGKANGQYLRFFGAPGISANRQVDTVLSLAGMLTGLTYPTGGSTSYVYEHNRGVAPSFMVELLYPPNNPVDNQHQSVFMLKNPMYYDGTMYAEQVAIGTGINGMVNFMIDRPWCSGTPSDPAYCDYTVRLVGTSHTYNLFNPPGSVSQSLAVEPGLYVLEVIPNHTHDVNDYLNTFFVTLDWYEDVYAEPEEELWFGAGKRIREIVHENPGQQAYRRSYTYTETNGKTSGAILGLPAFYHLVPDQVGQFFGVFHSYYPSGMGSPLTNLQGNQVGYGRVTEYFGSLSENYGKTEHTFTMFADDGFYYRYPFHLPVDNEWSRGRILEQHTYRKTATGYELVRQLTNKYLYGGIPDSFEQFYEPFFHIDSMYAYTIAPTHFHLPLINFVADLPSKVPGSYRFMRYYLMGGRIDAYHTQIRDYSGGVAVATENHYYTYNYPKHYQLAGERVEKSNGEVEGQLYSYPPDYSDTGGFIGEMKSARQVAYPIEHLRYRETGSSVVYLQGTLSRYKTGGKALPDSRADLASRDPVSQSAFKISNRPVGQGPSSPGGGAFAPDSRYRTHAFYELYDGYGNLRQFKSEAGRITTYLWGYGGSYPVASIQNASYAQVSSVLGGTVIDGLNAPTVTSAHIRSVLDGLRSHASMKPALIRTYTYRPPYGMDSMTDPRGKVEYYKRDTFQRLQRVLDFEDNVLRDYFYHYKP